MNRWISPFILSLILLSLSACSPSKSSDMVAPPQVFEEGLAVGGNMNFVFNPQVDILFVIDHSDSMKEEQLRLQMGIDLFVENFGVNGSIDYRVGAMTVYDRIECAKFECRPPGHLVSPYISRNPEAKEQIREMLNVGTLAHGQGGPRFEELFSPILASLDPSVNQINGDFFRKDSRKVIIMVTDEDDRYAGISTDDFIAGLHQRVAPEMLDLYAVVATPGCPRDTYASPPDRISEVVRREGGRIFPICDESFGEHLASIGADIRRELLRKEIYLMDYPERDTLQLRYGGVPIPEGQGWHYHPDRNVITINSDLNIDYDPNATFVADYVKIGEL